MILWMKIYRALKKLYKDVPNKHKKNTDNNCMYNKAAHSGRSSGSRQAPDGACTTPPGITLARKIVIILATGALDVSVGAVIPDYPSKQNVHKQILK